MPTRILGSDVDVRLNNYALVGMAQSVEWTPNFNAQDIYQLGDTAVVDRSLEFDLTGSLELMATGALPGLLARMNVIRTAGTGVVTGYQFVSGGAGGKNAYTLAQTDMDEMVFDLTIHEKTDQTNFNRSIVIPRCFLTSMAVKADANGLGSSTLSFAADFMSGFDTPFHDVLSYFATRTSGSSFTISGAATPFTGQDIAYFYINERRFRKVATDATYGTFTAATGVTAITTTESYTIPVDALIRIVLYRTSGSSIFQPVNTGEQGTTARFLKGYQTTIYLAPASVSAPTSASQWLKIQNCDWNFDFKNTALRQIAYNSLGSSVYFRSSNYPFDISINATALESDWFDWKSVLDPAVKTFAGDITNSMYDLAPTSLLNSFNLVIIQYTRAGAKVAEYRFTDCRMDGMGMRAQVGDNSQVTWGLKASAYTIVGYNA